MQTDARQCLEPCCGSTSDLLPAPFPRPEHHRRCFSAPLTPLSESGKLLQSCELPVVVGLSGTAAVGSERLVRPRRSSMSTPSAAIMAELGASRTQEVSCLLNSVSAPGGVTLSAEQPGSRSTQHWTVVGDLADHHHERMPSFSQLLHPMSYLAAEEDMWHSMEDQGQDCPNPCSLLSSDDNVTWGAWDLPMQHGQANSTAAVAHSNKPSSTSSSTDTINPDIRMVWPVCLPLGTGLQANARMSVFVDNGEDLTCAASQQTERLCMQGEPQALPSLMQPQPQRSSSVLVMAGNSMELLTRTPVHQGAAVCSVPTNRAFSVSGAALLSQMAASSVGLPMRVLTLFASSAATGGLDAGSWEAGPAVNVLCAPFRVSEELNRLFCRIAADLLTLETDPTLAHAQIRDIHGFTYLPGSGSATAEASGARSPCDPSTPYAPSPFCSPAAAQLQARLLEGLSSRHAVLDAQQRGMRQPQPPLESQLTAQELCVCRHAWAKHFQPLMQQVAYLLTCVPSAFAGQLDGYPEWDQHSYCKTLAGMVAYLEHYRCWHTLAGLLQHASTIGVTFRYQGECVSRDSLSGAMLEQLLQHALHDDISIQYVPQNAAPSAFGQAQLPEVAALALAMASEWRSSRRSERIACSADGGATTPTVCFESVDEVLQMDTDAFQLEDVLAGEFKDWEQRWLTSNYSSNLNPPVLTTPPPAIEVAAQPAVQVVHGWAGALPWELIALVLSCIAIAVQYARQPWGSA